MVAVLSEVSVFQVSIKFQVDSVFPKYTMARFSKMRLANGAKATECYRIRNQVAPTLTMTSLLVFVGQTVWAIIRLSI
jgi:hypothetical protein